MTDFYQPSPELKNTYLHDTYLRSFLKRKLNSALLQEWEPGLTALGNRAATEILNLGFEAEAQPPEHIPYDAWGKRIDDIKVSNAWKRLGQIAVEEKLISTAYERKNGSFSRVHQMIRIYLFSPSSAIYSCPLAMTDGAARALELYGDENLKNHAFKKLTSSDPGNFWTSGQWMTEKTGGSDVALSTTIAKPKGNQFLLYGTKWFTSATTSEVTMTLARPEGAETGGRGLSLFYLELRDTNGVLNNIFVHRLKDKLGTKALPTAELTLNGTRAELVGGLGDGIKKMSSLFNITRIWNACVAVSYMRRGLDLAQDYATKRFAFGKLLKDQPLHQETLSQLEIEFEAGFLLVMKVAELLGREECQEGRPEESALLRILTPLAKLYTAKQAVHVSSEVLEAFGGAGYIEDTHLPRLLRDTQVLAIWEGTTNVLSLDTLRAIQKENALGPFFKDIQRLLAAVKNQKLNIYKEQIQQACATIEAFFKSHPSEEVILRNARYLSYGLARTYMAALLLEHTEWALQNDSSQKALESLRRWCRKQLVTLQLD